MPTNPLLTPYRVIDRVYRALDHRPLSTERPKTDSDAVDNPRTRFSEHDLLERANRAVIHVAGRAKACHVLGAVDFVNNNGASRGGLSAAGRIVPDHFRILPSRVFRHSAAGGTVRARRQSSETARTARARRAPSPAWPTYVSESGFVEVHPPMALPGDEVEVFYVAVPTPITTAAYDAGGASWPIDCRHEAAVVARVVASCRTTAMQEGAAINEKIAETAASPFLSTVRTTMTEDREVDVE